MARTLRAFLNRQIAAVLEEGRFKITATGKRPARSPKTANTGVIRLDWSYSCGDLCAGTGRTYVPPTCQLLVSVTDRQS